MACNRRAKLKVARARGSSLLHFWRVSEVQWTWEVRLRPLHECNGHTIFFRFLGYLALQRITDRTARATTVEIQIGVRCAFEPKNRGLSARLVSVTVPDRVRAHRRAGPRRKARRRTAWAGQGPHEACRMTMSRHSGQP